MKNTSSRQTRSASLFTDFVGRHPEALTVLVVAGIAALIRFPLRFEWFGEQDQARFLVDAILYRYEGGEILRTYFIQTSPLCLGVFSWLAAVLGNGSLLSVSNTLGVLAGITTTVAVYFLARTLGTGRLWAASIALGSSLVPGVFFTSLYGYPSAYALPFGVAAAAAVSHGVTRDCFRSRFLWLLAGWAAFTLMVLLKVDFALCGSLLLAVIVLQHRVTYRNVLLLLAMAAATALIALIVPASMLSHWRDMAGFATEWNEYYKPYRGLGEDVSAIWLATGPGTLLLMAAGVVALFFRREYRLGVALVVAWLIAVAPTWSFWGSILTISTRHAVPGALFTAIFLGLVAEKLFPRRRLVAVVFPVLLLLSNWPWGSPSYDLNFDLSGNLVGTYRTNRRAFAACRNVVDQVVASDKPVQILIGKVASRDVLGAIDVEPMIRYELAARAVEVRNQTNLPRPHYQLQTRRRDGTVHLFFDCAVCDLKKLIDDVGVGPSDISVISLAVSESPLLERRGIELRTFDLQKEFDRLSGRPSS
jgi:hypothetical protein